MTEGLRLVIQTPHELVLDARVRSARVPTESGLVGLRPRQEPWLSAVEPGLIVLRAGAAPRFAATAGGLLEADREGAVLYTPFAVVGDAADAVLDALDQALAAPDSDLAARRRLGELEERIVQQLRHRPPATRARQVHG